MKEEDKTNLIREFSKIIERLGREISELKEENRLLKKRLELWEPPKDGDTKKSWGC